MGLPICVETSFDTARTSTCATRMLSQIGRTLGKHSITGSDPALQPNRRFLRTDYGRCCCKLEGNREAGQGWKIGAVGHMKEASTDGKNQGARQQTAAETGQFAISWAAASGPIESQVGTERKSDHRGIKDQSGDAAFTGNLSVGVVRAEPRHVLAGPVRVLADRSGELIRPHSEERMFQGVSQAGLKHFFPLLL